MRKWFALLLLGLLCFSCVSFPAEADAGKEKVYIVPVEDTVERGLHSFLQRALSVAEENDAAAVIFHINTLGGAVDAAWDIGELFAESPIETVAWIDKQALSAGAYIALNAKEIYMSPGSTIGSAAIIDIEGNAAGKKAQSSWIASMKAAAEQNGRDPKYAEAMADVNNSLTDLGVGEGKLLTLTNTQAEEVGYSEGTVRNQEQLLQQLGLEDAEVKSIDESFAEKAARFLTNPYIIPILLTIGALGLVIELFSPGFGIPGLVGIAALGLFFCGHLLAGLAGYETIILFMLGLLLLILELFLPGGIAGSIGFLSIIGSLFLASDNNTHMAVSILIALVVSLSVSIIMVKVFGKQMKFLRRMILTDSTSAESGYVSNVNRLDLIGREGVTVTPLRPSGIASVDDERIDVVSEGSFIARDVPIKVVKTEGSRIVVRQIEKSKEG